MCTVFLIWVVLEEKDAGGGCSLSSLTWTIYNFVDPGFLGEPRLEGTARSESYYRSCRKTTKKQGHNLASTGILGELGYVTLVWKGRTMEEYTAQDALDGTTSAVTLQQAIKSHLLSWQESCDACKQKTPFTRAHG